MAIAINEVLSPWLDRDYTEADFERITARFPLPEIRRAESPITIEDLQIGDKVEYLGTSVKVICRAKTRFGQPFLLLDLEDETDHMQGVMWGTDESYLNTLVEKIGKGKEAVASGFVQEYPSSSGKLQMVVNSLDFADIRVIIPDSHVLGLSHTVMQTMLMIESLPEPYKDLALGGLELHWDSLLSAVDPESKRHKYSAGILTHLRWVLKALTYLYGKASNPVHAMLAIILGVQPSLADFKAGGRIEKYPGSVDYLYRILVKAQEAGKRPGDGLSPQSAMVAAVYLETGKIVEDRRIGPATFGAQTLLDVGESLRIPYTVIGPIQDLVVSRPVIYGVDDIQRPTDAWTLHFARYLVDQCG